MATLSLEERVEALEAEVARLKQERPGPTGVAQPWWERRFGAFKDDPMYDEAMRLGAEYRKSQPTPAYDDAQTIATEVTEPGRAKRGRSAAGP